MAYETEEQQVEAIKQFWKENGTSIVLGAVIGFGALFGWNYYQDHKESQSAQASMAYSEVLSLSDAANSTAMVGKVDGLKTEHAASSYASLAVLTYAEQLVNDNKFVEATEQLKWVVDQSNDTFESIAQLRLARVQLQLEQYGEAIATVEAIDEQAYQANALLVKAEALLAQGETEQAKSVLIEARDAEDGTVNPLLQMRLGQLGIDK
ncbi:YfgM family protein [Kangiella koreensis]|uniref:Ancillary SecYEG translocon subunit n=1 Tax=Kangiella koreensis (strain DSM 16069 / JCM 12317 / KCTC 12182 / SW-125) TaxID=523791 RepID=C7R5S4_KANKD|nr:tetratricopeptide repeat protein [Kangiella koreensis]ACV27248.1 conserved hypothetical protein [Kangiella koreensis DSM 16069]